MQEIEDKGYDAFLKEDFDSQSHVSVLLKRGSAGENLMKLVAGITFLEKEIQNQVGKNYEDFLSQTTGVESLEDVLDNMHGRIQTLKSGVERLRSHISEPYNQLVQQVTLLENLRMTCEFLRRIIHYLNYSQKLREQLHSNKTDIVKAASSLKELDETGKDIDLGGLKILDKKDFLQQCHLDIAKQASSMLEKGLEQQNQSQLGTALQVFYNMGTLSPAVDNQLNNFVKSVRYDVLIALDVNGLTNTISEKYKGPGKVAMPVIGQSTQFRANLWAGLENVMDSIYSCCMKTYQLYKVLSKKRDFYYHKCFLDEVYKVINEDLFSRMWKPVIQILTEEFARSEKDSGLLRKALEVDYPKLLRLYNDLWSRLEDIYADMKASFAASVQSDTESGLGREEQTELEPQAMLKKSLAPLERTYVSRSQSRLHDQVNLMFSTSSSVPSKEDIDALLRSIVSELNISAVDANLSIAIADSVVKTINLFCQKCEQHFLSSESWQVIGPPNIKQSLNISVVNQLIYSHKQIDRMISASLSHLPPRMVHPLLKTLPVFEGLIRSGIEPFFCAVTNSVKDIIRTIYQEDFSGDMHDSASEINCSLYMDELESFMNRIYVEYMQQFSQFSVVKQRIVDLCRLTFEYFVRHVTIVRPIGQKGKLRLAADFARIESVIEQYTPRLSELGRSYKLVQSFRPLLFQDANHVASLPIIGDIVPHSTLLHFLFSRATPEMRSPFQSAGWTQTEYSDWLDKHRGEAERLTLVKGALEAYERYVKSKQLSEFDPVYPVMKALLQKGFEAVEPKKCSA